MPNLFLMKLNKLKLTRNKLSMILFGLSAVLLLSVFLLGKHHNIALTDNFRLVEKGTGSTYLIQDRVCGGYYILEQNDIKSLEEPKEDNVFDKATTIIDNLGK